MLRLYGKWWTLVIVYTIHHNEIYSNIKYILERSRSQDTCLIIFSLRKTCYKISVVLRIWVYSSSDAPKASTETKRAWNINSPLQAPRALNESKVLGKKCFPLHSPVKQTQTRLFLEAHKYIIKGPRILSYIRILETCGTLYTIWHQPINSLFSEDYRYLEVSEAWKRLSCLFLLRNLDHYTPIRIRFGIYRLESTSPNAITRGVCCRNIAPHEGSKECSKRCSLCLIELYARTCRDIHGLWSTRAEKTDGWILDSAINQRHEYVMAICNISSFARTESLWTMHPRMNARKPGIKKKIFTSVPNPYNLNP